MSDHNAKTKPDGAESLSTAGLGAEACRAAFVNMIKDENFYREPGCKASLKAHWTGADGGFSDEWLQRRWKDFEAGWAAKPVTPNGLK